MRTTRAAAALLLTLGAVLLSTPPAHAANAVQGAVDRAVTAAAADGIRQSVAVVDRSTGERVATSGGDQQYISESIVKLFTVAYYEVRAGGEPDAALVETLRSMIINSDDRIESELWSTDIVPTIAARYGLTHTRNGPKTGPHDWGWELITASDEADFLSAMSNDPKVAPLLMGAMADVAPVGADGFDQSFGLNALTGDHGSKQGWTDVGSSSQVQIHSVGWTDRYFVAILQTATGVGYEAMRATSTATAKAVLAAETATAPPDATRNAPARSNPPATPTVDVAPTIPQELTAQLSGVLEAIRRQMAQTVNAIIETWATR